MFVHGQSYGQGGQTQCHRQRPRQSWILTCPVLRPRRFIRPFTANWRMPTLKEVHVSQPTCIIREIPSERLEKAHEKAFYMARIGRTQAYIASPSTCVIYNHLIDLSHGSIWRCKVAGNHNDWGQTESQDVHTFKLGIGEIRPRAAISVSFCSMTQWLSLMTTLAVYTRPFCLQLLNNRCFGRGGPASNVRYLSWYMDVEAVASQGSINCHFNYGFTSCASALRVFTSMIFPISWKASVPI